MISAHVMSVLSLLMQHPACIHTKCYLNILDCTFSIGAGPYSGIIGCIIYVTPSIEKCHPFLFYALIIVLERIFSTDTRTETILLACSNCKCFFCHANLLVCLVGCTKPGSNLWMQRTDVWLPGLLFGPGRSKAIFPPKLGSRVMAESTFALGNVFSQHYIAMS